jgi:hypothetical protein
MAGHVHRNTQQLAIKGFGLQTQVDGTFLIIKWDYCREVDSLDAASRFLAQLGGR